ncbi:MAG: radical SAM family heme chaperone HemW [Acidobacteria bacterium]|nr:radical SAM family heme chaperone HemW [Acidobacteriota bacterium]
MTGTQVTWDKVVGTALGLYIHIPFCEKKCSYCDFRTGSYEPAVAGRYARALVREVETFRARGRHSADTVFFGGGTPSLLIPAQLESILAALHEAFEISADVEITLEANPGTLEPEKARAFRSLGVNRISLGVQSFDDAELRRLRRTHDSGAARRAVSSLRRVGFQNFNLDLILGVPGQTDQSWRNNLKQVAELAAPHLSVYMLELHEGTHLFSDYLRGTANLPAEDQVADWYLETVDFLTGLGYNHYEISNFALPGRECRHNLKYWNNEEYIGFGLSSHSHWRGLRFWNEPALLRYLERVKATGEAVAGSEVAQPSERIFLGLRKTEGVPLREVEGRVERFFEAGLLERVGDRVRLTRRGILVSNEIFAQLV